MPTPLSAYDKAYLYTLKEGIITSTQNQPCLPCYKMAMRAMREYNSILAPHTRYLAETSLRRPPSNSMCEECIEDRYTEVLNQRYLKEQQLQLQHRTVTRYPE